MTFRLYQVVSMIALAIAVADAQEATVGQYRIEGSLSS
jgi:uncharacterized membrane protein YsdA (DUF1294 family)